MAYCSSCGKELAADIKFCPYCGKPIDQVNSDEKNVEESARNIDYAKKGVCNQNQERTKPKRKIGCGTVILIVIAIYALYIIVRIVSSRLLSDTTETKATTEKVTIQQNEKVSYEQTGSYYTVHKNYSNESVRGYVEITNTGSVPIYLGSAKFIFEDNNGHLLGTQDLVSSYPSVVMPGKRGYYECCYDYDDLDASNGVNIKCEYEIKKANQKYYPLKISDVTVKQNDSSVGIMGRIENPYDEDFDVYEVEIILRNSKGKVIGLGLTNDVDGVKARSSTAFDTRVSIFGDQSENDVDSYELYAHPWYLQY